MKSVKPRYRWLLVAVLAVVTAASGCAPGFRMAEIPPEQIPAEVSERYRGKDVVWRACYEQGDYTIVWLDEPISMAGGMRTYTIVAGRRDGSGTFVGGHTASFGDAARTTAYAWTTGRGSSGSVYWIDAAGVAFSRNAHKVVGELTSGEKIEAPVVNGFWYLAVDNPKVDWARVVVLDSRGRALHTFERPL